MCSSLEHSKIEKKSKCSYTKNNKIEVFTNMRRFGLALARPREHEELLTTLAYVLPYVTQNKSYIDTKLHELKKVKI